MHHPLDRPSLYVHVPFCAIKCGYCDFTSYELEDRGVLDAYLDALADELAMHALPSPPPTVFVGGGTPTLLDPPRLRRLLRIVDGAAHLSRCSEATIEANPESVTAEKLSLALELGITRVSIGAQSFEPRHLAFLDRPHGPDAIDRAMAAARLAGCTNVGLDLIFAIPGQTIAEWEKDLEHALALAPDHLSCYALTFEPGTRLAHRLRRGEVQPPDEDLQRDMLVLTRERLARAGFVAYEISNFAGPGGPCLHNDRYWLQADYVGVGPGAASHRAGVRSTNLKAFPSWREAIRRGLPPVAEAETLSPEHRAAEAVWLGLRRSEGVDLDAVSRRLGVEVGTCFAREIDGLLEDGLATRDGPCLRLTPRGTLFADEVGQRFLLAGPSLTAP